MKPVQFKEANTVIGKFQKEYEPLPAFKGKGGEVVSCWKLNLKERVKILFSGKVWIGVLAFNKPYPPTFMTTDKADLLKD